MDATGAVAGAIGAVEVIIHRNPTQIGSSLGNLLNGSEAANYIVSLAGNDTVSGGDGRDTLAGAMKTIRFPVAMARIRFLANRAMMS